MTDEAVLALLRTPLDVIDAELARRSLREFVRQAWPHVEPATPFVPGWHLDAIADHLQAVTEGHIRQLLITMPPRHMKSISVGVMWPAWEWTARPERRHMVTSYALSLAIRDTMRTRRLLESPWYQARWGRVVQLAGDQNTKGRYDNTAGGYRIAGSVGSGVTGEGGDCVVCDDPISVADAHSDTIRQTALDWWDQTMSTRLNDPKTGARVIVMQRTHERDLAGHVLEQGGYEHLNLPAEYEPSRRSTTCIGFADPRTVEGELLHPDRFGHADIDALKTALGSYAASGQLQQRPAPAGGGMFKREWFRVVDSAPATATRCRFWDCAGTADGGDYTVGVKVAKAPDNTFCVESVIRGQWSAHEVDRVIVQTAQADGQACRIREEQEPGSSGKAIIAVRLRQLAGFDYKGVPATGEKTSHWRPFAAQCEGGNVSLLRALWNTAFLDELLIAPNGAHDDQVDAASGSFTDLTMRGPVAVVRLSGF